MGIGEEQSTHELRKNVPSSAILQTETNIGAHPIKKTRIQISNGFEAFTWFRMRSGYKIIGIITNEMLLHEKMLLHELWPPSFGHTKRFWSNKLLPKVGPQQHNASIKKCRDSKKW